MARSVHTRATGPGASNGPNVTPTNNSNKTKLICKAPADTAISALKFYFSGKLQWQTGEENYNYAFDARVDIEYPVDGTYTTALSAASAVKTFSPGDAPASLDATVSIPAGATYVVWSHALFDWTPPVATVTVSGNAISSKTITNGGTHLNLGHSTALAAPIPAGAGAGTGGSITPVIVGGVLTDLTLVGGSGYTNGTYSIVFTGGVWVAGAATLAATGEGTQWGNALANETGVSKTISAQGVGCFPPAVIIGTQATAAPAIANLGDSLDFGQNDTATASDGLNGYFQKAILRGHGGFDLARGFNSARLYVASHSWQSLMLANCTHLYCALGFNDFFVHGDSLATLQTNLRAIWAPFIAAGIPVYQATLTPNTTSSDSWATTGNQTTTSISARLTAFNVWLRANWQAEGLAAVIDIAAIVEDGGIAAPTAKFRVDLGAPTTDGVHWQPVIHDAIRTAGILYPTAGGLGRKSVLTWT